MSHEDPIDFMRVHVGPITSNPACNNSKADEMSSTAA